MTPKEAMRDLNIIAAKLTITQWLELGKMISTIRNHINDTEWLEKELERDKKVEKLLELYKRLFNVCKEYKCASIGLSNDSEFLNIMSELENKLSKVGVGE